MNTTGHRFAGDEVVEPVNSTTETDVIGLLGEVPDPSEDPEPVPPTGSGSPNLPDASGKESGPVLPPAGPDLSICPTCGTAVPFEVLYG